MAQLQPQTSIYSAVLFIIVVLVDVVVVDLGTRHPLLEDLQATFPHHHNSSAAERSYLKPLVKQIKSSDKGSLQCSRVRDRPEVHAA